MKYLQYTRHLPLILCVDGKSIGIWIDGSQPIHADMRGCVELYASMKKGAVMSSTKWIKFNTPRLTETEILAVR